MDLFPLSEETLETMSKGQLIAVVLASQKLHPPRLLPIIDRANRRRGPPKKESYHRSRPVCRSCGNSDANFNCDDCGLIYCGNCDSAPTVSDDFRICKTCHSEAMWNMPTIVRTRGRKIALKCTLCGTESDDFKGFNSGRIICVECQNDLASKPLVDCTFCGHVTGSFICRICKKELCGACEDGTVSATELKPITNGDRVCSACQKDYTCHKDQLKQTQPALKPLKSCRLCKKIPQDAYICHKCETFICHECQDTLPSRPSDQHFCRECLGIIVRGAVGAA